MGAAVCVDEPLRDHLPVVPAAVAGHAVGDPGHVAGRHAQPVRRMAAELRPAVVELEPPVLDPERLEQRLDGELVVRLAGDVLAHQGRVGQARGSSSRRRSPDRTPASPSAASPVWPRMYSQVPSLGAPVASGQMPEV